METILKLAVLCVHVFAIVAVGVFAWHGEWAAVGVAFGAIIVAKLAFGLLEVLLTPLSILATYFIRRGISIPAFLFTAMYSLLNKIAYLIYCVSIVIYFTNAPGPPPWLAVMLAMVVAMAPFAWAVASKNSDGEQPHELDSMASFFGVGGAGIMMIFGIDIRLALIPLEVFFVLSAGHLVFWLAKNIWPDVRERYLSLRDLS